MALSISTDDPPRPDLHCLPNHPSIGPLTQSIDELLDPGRRCLQHPRLTPVNEAGRIALMRPCMVRAVAAHTGSSIRLPPAGTGTTSKFHPDTDSGPRLQQWGEGTAVVGAGAEYQPVPRVLGVAGGQGSRYRARTGACG